MPSFAVMRLALPPRSDATDRFELNNFYFHSTFLELERNEKKWKIKKLKKKIIRKN